MVGCRRETGVAHQSQGDGMKPLADAMAAYAAYHRTPGNKAIHFVFVPLIVWSLMVLLSIPSGPVVDGIELKLSMAVAAIVLVYYLRLDYTLGIAMVVLFTVLEVSALEVAAMGWATALAVGGTVFVVAWVAQVVGHSFYEHRRPALVDNVWQVFTAPIFVVAEWAFALGWREDLKDAVDARLAQPPT